MFITFFNSFIIICIQVNKSQITKKQSNWILSQPCCCLSPTNHNMRGVASPCCFYSMQKYPIKYALGILCALRVRIGIGNSLYGGAPVFLAGNSLSSRRLLARVTQGASNESQYITGTLSSLWPVPRERQPHPTLTSDASTRQHYQMYLPTWAAFYFCDFRSNYNV